MTGKIIRGVGGFYYVRAEDGYVYECRARGIFRLEKVTPLAGDDVVIEVSDETDREGSIQEILPRRNALIRPPAANVDQALVIFALSSPDPNFPLLDRFLILMRREQIPALICFNKTDLTDEEECQRIAEAYRGCGCRVFFMSLKEGEGREEVRDCLQGKTTVLAGPSGVGKSSFTNWLCPEAEMEVGAVSRKNRRGKQTTRHTELLRIGEDTYLLDTPGFSSLFVNDLTPEEAREMYPEFEALADQCRFQGCMHMAEPGCAVKEAVAAGRVSAMRYDSYCQLIRELRDVRRF